MGVASHLNIKLEEYDERIRTFVPFYEEMISTAAEVLTFLQSRTPTILDLGIGTGELAERCSRIVPNAHLVGIDIDPAMLELANKRLMGHPSLRLIAGDFRNVPFPPCDAIVSCISLHHIRSAEEKKRLYEQCVSALRPGGIFVTADCFPSEEGRLARAEREGWIAHLERTYPPAEAEAHLTSWAEEDFYAPLKVELRSMEEAGLRTEVVWRKSSFAVIAGIPQI